MKDNFFHLHVTNGWSGVKNISGLHTSALVLSGIAPRIKHSHKTLGLRPRVLCSCFMLGVIPDKTAASVCNPYLITINRPAQTRNFHGPPECNGGPAGGTLARTAGFFYGRPEWATLVGLPSTTILSYVAIFAIAGAMEPWQHHFFRQRNTEWLRVTNPTQCDSHSLHLNRPRLHAFFQVHALVEHISSRSATCLHKTKLERKRTRSILPSSFFFERKNEKAR